jgi:hypothetical protein
MSFPCGTPVAGDIFIEPVVQFKAVEADALRNDGNFGEVGADLGVEAVPVHAEVERGVAETDDPREQDRLT